MTETSFLAVLTKGVAKATRIKELVMAKDMPGGIRPGTVRLLAEIATRVANGSLTHWQLERITKGLNPFDFCAIDWVGTYSLLGSDLKHDYVRFAKSFIPYSPGMWDVPILRGLDCDKIIKAFENLGVRMKLYDDDLDAEIISSERNPNRDGSYLAYFRNTDDGDCLGHSFETLRQHNIKSITILECLLLGLGYFVSFGKMQNTLYGVLCAGTEYCFEQVAVVSSGLDCVGNFELRVEVVGIKEVSERRATRLLC